jgi:hypothetical protein
MAEASSAAGPCSNQTILLPVLSAMEADPMHTQISNVAQMQTIWSAPEETHAKRLQLVKISN